MLLISIYCIGIFSNMDLWQSYRMPYIYIYIYHYHVVIYRHVCKYIYIYKTSIHDCVYLTFHVFGQIIATSADVTSGLVRIIPPKIPLFQL